MLDDLVTALRERVSGQRALDAVRELSRFHRIQASPGYDAAADWLAAQIERAGLRVEIERVPGDGRTRRLGYLMPQGWACERAVATLHGDGAPRTLCDFPVSPLSLIQRSVAARGRFSIAVLEDGSEPPHYEGLDVRGRVVLTAGDVHRVHDLAVVERHAAGLLSFGRRLVHPVRDASTDTEALAYTSFWWSEHAPRGWGFVISPREAAHLRGRLRDGAKLELEIEIESRTFDTTIALVSAVQPGAADDAPGETLIVSHLCHPQPGANDNASGAAANLEAARAIREFERTEPAPPRRRAIRHLWMPEFTGTFAWLGGEAGLRRTADLVAALNLDMVGEDQNQCGSTFLIEHPPHFAASFAETLIALIRERSAEWVLSYSGPGHVPIHRMAEVPFSGGSDHAVLIDPALGVPCPMLIQWPDRYYHSSLDTPDRCDPASLALAARCAAVYAAFAARITGREAGWLASRIARRARTRLLAALERDDAPRAARVESERARSALASLRRLGGGRDPHQGADGADQRTGDRAQIEIAIERERQGLSGFWSREIEPALDSTRTGERPEAGGSATGGLSAGPGDPAARASSVLEDVGSRRVPRRRLSAALHFQRWLIEGWDDLPRSQRERWRALESGAASFAPLLDLAWMACDGVRSLGEIADLVWLESGRRAEVEIGEFFEWTCALGLCEWRPEGEQ
ncbi:MAG: DUF4910 domain-containing protein [Candidatus Eisenbacteria bacterium]|nr:DUF4910 domain-containing protein [Candidatus Eisenbacteria bacterium]